MLQNNNINGDGEIMKNATEYYQNSIKRDRPSRLLADFFRLKLEKNLKEKNAIDLGCGAGNDTVFLLEKGFEVTAIDSEPQVKEVLSRRAENQQNLNVVIDDFSKVQLLKADLINANYSLFFVKKDFNEMLRNVLKSINKNGYFVGNFLGKEDDWNKSKTTLDKDELLNYFSKFKIVYYSEEKYYKDTLTKKNKFWHVYNIIAQKK